MICPRWLVQSSAAGVVGVALIAIPLSMTYTPEEQNQYQEFHSQNVEIRPVIRSSVNQRDGVHKLTIEERNLRAQQVRYHLYELYEGPHCPAEVDARNKAAVDEAQSIIDEAWQNALE